MTVDIRHMRPSDLDAVVAIERATFPTPWTRGIFQDCLRASHPAWVLHRDGAMIGYGMLSMAADEAHVLNVCAAPEEQGRGHGRRPDR